MHVVNVHMYVKYNNWQVHHVLGQMYTNVNKNIFCVSAKIILVYNNIKEHVPNIIQSHKGIRHQ